MSGPRTSAIGPVAENTVYLAPFAQGIFGLTSKRLDDVLVDIRGNNRKSDPDPPEQKMRRLLARLITI